MKTKQFIYVIIYFLLISIAIITENLIPALLLMLLAGSDYLIIKKDNTISQLTSRLADAEKKLVEKEDELHHSVSVVKNQFQEINNLKTELETAKANSYHEVERKRCREKYNRLYKGKKKSVAAEQPYQIEGKSIKQLVEENLGIVCEHDGQIGEICGYTDVSAIIGNVQNGHNGLSSKHTKIIKQCNENSYFFVNDDIDFYNAIKKYRNIQ